MIDIISKKCKENSCNKKPHFNYKNEKIPIYCNDHKKKNMINIINKKCIEKNCNTQSSFNFKNKNVAIYCNKHKKENMINIKIKKCKENNCNIQATYNYINKIPEYCNKHKKENMINMKSKRCLEKNCNKQPSFNLPSEKIGIYCTEHKKENMINVKNKKCQEENCNKIPAYNFNNEIQGIYCNEHKKNNMVNIKSKRCKEKNCDTIVHNKKYKGYCLRCFINLFPNEKVSRNYKVKENHMTDFLKEEFKEQIMVFDKQTGGCSKRRPDCYIDKFTHVVIIECDENQHKDTSCENKRTMELFQDFGNRPVVFIRFNPDSYIKDGKKISSSFKMHKTLDVPVVRDPKEWKLRLDLLKETINKFLENTMVPEKEITYEYLFYDQ
jgi:hypothetical protein